MHFFDEAPVTPEPEASEIWIDSTDWPSLYVYYDYNTRSWPGTELSRNDSGYYVWDISDVAAVQAWLFTDGTNQTSDLGTSLSAVQAYAGKIIKVTANSSTIEVIE